MKNISINKDKNSFSIIDSYTMLPNSLRKLGISFEVDTLKTNFPYKFAASNNLFYKGSL